MSNPIRVLLADDNALVRQGIRAMLDSAKEIEVVGEAKDGQEAIDLADGLEPDVVIMDISMPRLDGLRATEFIRRTKKAIQVLILSMHDNPTFVRQALRRGAGGYVLKRALAEELLPAIHRVRRGKLFLSQELRTK